MVKTSIRKNLYYEIKDRAIEDRYENGVKLPPLKQRVRVYGTDSTKQVRARLIEILYERVEFHKDKFIAPIIYKELETMEVKKNGRVEHSDGCHDDQVFSYLMALRVWYDGENLVENFGIRKNTIKTDEDIEIEDLEIEKAEYAQIEIQDETFDEEEDDIGIQETMQYIADAAKYKLAKDYKEEMYMKHLQQREQLFRENRDLRNAYDEQYNIERDENSTGISYVTLPDSLFQYWDDEDMETTMYIERNGNLFDQFAQL